MITLNASGGSITFEFSGNSTYLNDGTITVPVNSLALIIDESNMITLKKAASNDIFVSANIAEFGMTKAELESWFKENAVGSTGGGGADTVDGTSLFGGIHYANEGTSAKLFSKMFEGYKPSALKFVVGNGNNTYSSAITITLYDTDYNEYPNTLTISSSGGAVTSITEANGGSFTGITVDSDWVLRPSEGYFFNSYQWLISNYGLGLRISPKDGVIESGSTTDVIENGIYKQLQRHEENIGNLATSAVTSTNLSFKDESGITLTTNASSTALAVDDSLKYVGKLGVYVTGDTYTTNLNSESATTYINLDGIKNVDMWLNQSYTGTPSGWYTIYVKNLDNSNDYYLYENNAFTFVTGTAGSTLNYDSSTGKLSITCPSGIAAINNVWKFAPKDDLTNADCFIGLVSYTSNEYPIQDAIDSKVNVSGNVVSAYSFDKSTKIAYPGITAERTPSIPSGTKKISIGFTMLPANNQLFETLQFIRPNPFAFADVASGLTVGVAEDTSSFPFTYTVTSVTWTGDDSIMAYDLSENDTLLNLYAQGDYQFSSVVPKGINLLEMYIDVLEDIESGQTAEVVNDGVVKNFENVGKYLQNERNRVDNKIDNKLDATAYTPVVSSIMQGSTNPVEGGALFDELRVQTSSGGGETTITFDSSNYSTNYPLGCTSLKVNVGAVDEFVSIYFYNGSNTNLGEISVANFGGIEVTNNTLPGATYEISGNIVTLSYPAQGIVKIEKRYSENFSFSAVNPPVYATLKNVVDGKLDSSDVTSAVTSGSTDVLTSGGAYEQFGGLKLVKLTESEYAALVTKDPDVLYVVIPDPTNP